MRVTHPKIILTDKILFIARGIQNAIGRSEFSILVKGYWTENGFELSNEYAIPEQTVSLMSVDYDNQDEIAELKKSGFNVVIHSHPFAETSTFSPADRDTINSHFDASLLLAGNGFVDASLRIQVVEGLQLHLKPEIEIVPSEVAVDVTKIKKACIPSDFIPRLRKTFLY